MRKDKRKKLPAPALFTRRSLIVFGCQGLIAAGLGARMYQLQAVEGAQYRKLAERSRIKPRLLAPVRGRILSSDGTPLAINRPNYQAVLYRERTDDVAATLKKLAPMAGLSPEQIEELIEESEQTLEFLPFIVAENLEWKDFARINANAPALPGIEPQVGLTRHYPAAERAAHIVGYVAAASEEDIARGGENAALLKLPDMQIGRSGIERMEEDFLRGEAGLVRLERDVRGRPIRELERRDGARGKDLTLTLDMELQDYALKRLGEEAGSVVVMDIYDGDVLALASSPTYDPNAFVLGMSESEWRSLQNNERRPLNNQSVAGLYPPGSTYKMVVALAALEAGVVGTGHSVRCIGHTELGNRNFHCWKRGGHGTLGMREAIKQSCDVYFYDLAKRVGIDRLAEVSRRFGLGELPEIGLADAKSGIMPDKDWKWARFGESWQTGETLNAGIGQGYMLSSPLQLAQMTATIANGGYRVQPRLVKARAGDRIKALSLEGTGLERAHVELIQDAMTAVVNEKRGTARGSRILLPGLQLAGKTGTAQVRRISKAERLTGVLKNDELPWNLRDHALFVGFVPADKPRYAISVVVEHGGGGSKVAAPIARDVILQMHFPDELPENAVPKQATPVFRLPKKKEEEDGGTDDTGDEA